MILKSSENRVCVFCKLEHRVYLKKEVSVFDAFLMLAVTGLLAQAIWGGPDLRSMLIFFALIFSAQMFLRVRYRNSVRCPHCGFDPILYQQEPELAATRVKDHMDNRKDNPQYMLKPIPQIQPVIQSTDRYTRDLIIPTDETETAPQSITENAPEVLTNGDLSPSSF